MDSLVSAPTLTVIAAFYIVIGFVTFGVYGWDKAAAKKNRRRVSERTLHVLALLGGWPGALLAQRWLRHKTQKGTFQVVFWLTVVTNCVAVGWWIVSGMA